MKKSKPSLSFCLLMDAVGMASYFFPFIGEGFDVVWAPLSAFLFYNHFSGKVARIGSIIDFAEEILPFTDFIPTFTLAYFYLKLRPGQETTANN